MYLAGWPDASSRTVTAGVAVPGMLSWLLYGDTTRPVPGLDQLEDRYGSPPVWLSFQSYHLMVGLGMLFIVSTLYASWCWWRGTLFGQRWLLWYFVFAVALAVAANQLGWAAAEVGRQPWVVYPVLDAAGQVVGGLRTSDGVSEVITSTMVLGSICMFGLIYAVLFALWIFLLDRAIRRGPAIGSAVAATGERGDAMAALAARAAHVSMQNDLPGEAR